MELTKSRLIALVSLRLAIGWHFLYEGGVKVLNPSWTSKTYLMDSGGFAKPFFEWIAGNPTALLVADFTNAWGLTLIGISLIIGLFTRISSLSAMLLLLLYYISHPSFPGIEYLFPSDGSYFLINKTLVEFFALWVLFVFPTSQHVGLQRLLKK